MRATTVITNDILIEILKNYGFVNPELSGIYNIDVSFDYEPIELTEYDYIPPPEFKPLTYDKWTMIW